MALYLTLQFTRGGYLPHCTIQKAGRLHSGDKVAIDTLALVDTFPAMIGGEGGSLTCLHYEEDRHYVSLLFPKEM